MRTLIGLLIVGFILDLIAPDSKNNVQEAWIPIALGVASLAMSAYKVYTGIRQQNEAKKLAAEEQPEVEIPKAIRDMVDTRKYLAGLTDAPGSDVARASDEERAAQMFSEGKTLARSGTQAQGMLEDKYANLTEADRTREQGSAQYQLAQQGALAQAQGTLGHYQNQAFQQNTMEPFYRRQAQASALTQAGQSNIIGGIGDAVGSGIDLYGAGAFGATGAEGYFGADAIAQRQMGREASKAARGGTQQALSPGGELITSGAPTGTLTKQYDPYAAGQRWQGGGGNSYTWPK